MADILNPHSGRAMSSIDLGSRVVLRGEPDSPVMTTIMPMIGQGSGADVIGWVCGWFNTTYAPGPDNTLCENKQWNQIQLPIQCMELAKESIQ